MDEIVYLLYSHTDYNDILQIHLSYLFKYLKGIRIAVCINDSAAFKQAYSSMYDFFAIYEYDDSKPFGERVYSVLSRINAPYILFNPDTNIFIDNVNMSCIDFILKRMKEDSIDQVRLFISGIQNPVLKGEFSIEPIKEGYFYSVNTALWNRVALTSIFERYRNVAYREFEIGEIQSYVQHQCKNYYLCSQQDFIIPNEGHFFSVNVPFVHVTFMGRWRNSPFNSIFINMFAKEFQIDLKKRGTWF